MLIVQSQSMVDGFINRYDNPNTRLPYLQSIHRFYDYLTYHGFKSLSHVKQSDIEAFKEWLETAKNEDGQRAYSDKTCSMTIATLKQFYLYLQQCHEEACHIARLNNSSMPSPFYNPTVGVKGTKVDLREQKTEVLTEFEVNKVLEVIYNIKDSYQCNSLKVMFLLFVNAGLREAELVNLRRSDMTIQGDRFVLKVVGKGMRSRFITLSIPVTYELIKAFSELKIKGDALVIQGKDRAGNRATQDAPLNPKSVFLRVRKLANLAGINKDISPHSLRRTCATIMYKRGVPLEGIQRLLGHDNPSTTHRYLDLHIDIEMSAKYALDLTHEEAI